MLKYLKRLYKRVEFRIGLYRIMYRYRRDMKKVVKGKIPPMLMYAITARYIIDMNSLRQRLIAKYSKGI